MSKLPKVKAFGPRGGEVSVIAFMTLEFWVYNFGVAGYGLMH